MPQTWITADLHLRHRKIVEFEPFWSRFATVEERDEWMADMWADTVSKRDVVYVLGDVAMNRDGLADLGRWPGKKKLIAGNHDTMDMQAYLEVFTSVRACHIFDNRILASHFPVHPASVKGRFHGNVHGHVHSHTLDDPLYLPACLEANGGNLLPLEAVRRFFPRPLVIIDGVVARC